MKDEHHPETSFHHKCKLKWKDTIHLTSLSSDDNQSFSSLLLLSILSKYPGQCCCSHLTANKASSVHLVTISNLHITSFSVSAKFFSG